MSIVRVDVGTLLDPGAAAVPCRRGLRCLVSDVWPIVHVERAALIDDLADLTDGQWAHASLCGDWTLHDVAAHLINFVLASKPGDARYLLRLNAPSLHEPASSSRSTLRVARPV